MASAGRKIPVPVTLRELLKKQEREKQELALDADSDSYKGKLDFNQNDRQVWWKLHIIK